MLHVVAGPRGFEPRTSSRRPLRSPTAVLAQREDPKLGGCRSIQAELRAQNDRTPHVFYCLTLRTLDPAFQASGWAAAQFKEQHREARSAWRNPRYPVPYLFQFSNQWSREA